MGTEQLAAVQLQTAPDPGAWLDRHGDYLYRYALVRLRDPQNAEDVVQETLLAALQGSAAFAGRGSERTWLTGILKHKIIDHFRRVGREAQPGAEDEGRDWSPTTSSRRRASGPATGWRPSSRRRRRSSAPSSGARGPSR